MATQNLSVGSPRVEAQYHVMAGEMAARRQQPEFAAEEFLKALEYISDTQLAARATALALAANREGLALTAARKWLAIEPSSLDAREVITRLAVHTGLADEAFAQSQAIVRDHPGGIDDGLRHVALLLSQDPDKPDTALALMDRLVAEYPKRPGAYAAKGLLALRFQRFDVAEQAAREAVRLDPTSRDAALLLTGALVKKGAISEADGIVDNITKDAKDAADVRLGYVRLLLDANQRESARNQLQRILKLQPDHTDAQLALGLLDLDEHKLDEAESRFQNLSKIPDRQNNAYYFLGRIYELRNQPQQALAFYEKVTAGDQALDAAAHRGAMLGRLKRVGEARQLFAQLRRQYPPLSEHFYIAEGEMLLDAGQGDDALSLYGKALQQTPDDPDLLYSRALAFERLNQVNRAESDLRQVLSGSPDDARALNALGYMLIEHTDHYDEAGKLINRAFQLTPNDPAIIDSMGWVQYKQGRPQDAIPLLKRAFEMFPDPEIAAHLGEVLWALGNKDQARSVWNTALKSAPDDPVLRATVNRLTQ